MTDNEKQQINERFVNQNVIMLASQLVDDLSKNLMFNHCDIYEVAENLQMTEEEAIDAGFESLEQAQDAGQDYKEVLEWWFVSEYFYDKLKELGYVVYDSDYGYLWGRETSGQAISIDWIISEICEQEGYYKI